MPGAGRKAWWLPSRFAATRWRSWRECSPSGQVRRRCILGSHDIEIQEPVRAVLKESSPILQTLHQESTERKRGQGWLDNVRLPQRLHFPVGGAMKEWRRCVAAWQKDLSTQQDFWEAVGGGQFSQLSKLKKIVCLFGWPLVPLVAAAGWQPLVLRHYWVVWG